MYTEDLRKNKCVDKNLKNYEELDPYLAVNNRRKTKVVENFSTISPHCD